MVTWSHGNSVTVSHGVCRVGLDNDSVESLFAVECVARRLWDQIRVPICNYLGSHHNSARCVLRAGLVIVGGGDTGWLAGWLGQGTGK